MSWTYKMATLRERWSCWWVALGAVTVMGSGMGCEGDSHPAPDTIELDTIEPELDIEPETDTAKPNPRAGEPCTSEDVDCCINGYRALFCSARPGLDGSWSVQSDAGCPCSSHPSCGPTRPPPCQGAPDNFAMPKDAQ